MNTERELTETFDRHYTQAEQAEFLMLDWPTLSRALGVAAEVMRRRQQSQDPDRDRAIAVLQDTLTAPGASDITPRYCLAQAAEILSPAGEMAVKGLKYELQGTALSWQLTALGEVLRAGRAPITAEQLLTHDRNSVHHQAYALADRLFRRWGRDAGQPKRDDLDAAFIMATAAGRSDLATTCFLLEILSLLSTTMDKGAFLRILAASLPLTSAVEATHTAVQGPVYRLNLTLSPGGRELIGTGDLGFSLPSTRAWLFDWDKFEGDVYRDEKSWLKVPDSSSYTDRGDQLQQGVVRSGHWQALACINGAIDEHRFLGVDELQLGLRSAIVVILAEQAAPY